MFLSIFSCVQAVSTYSEALKCLEDDDACLVNRAIAYAMLGESDNAMDDFNKACEFWQHKARPSKKLANSMLPIALCVGSPFVCWESLWVWGVPLGVGSPSGYGESLWVWGISLGVGNPSGCGEYLWVWGIPLGVGSPSGCGESLWVYGILLACNVDALEKKSVFS